MLVHILRNIEDTIAVCTTTMKVNVDEHISNLILPI